MTSIILHVFLFLCHSGADDETLLYQNEAIQETVEIYDSEVKILEAASSSAASSSAVIIMRS